MLICFVRNYAQGDSCASKTAAKSAPGIRNFYRKNIPGCLYLTAGAEPEGHPQRTGH